MRKLCSFLLVTLLFVFSAAPWTHSSQAYGKDAKSAGNSSLADRISRLVDESNAALGKKDVATYRKKVEELCSLADLESLTYLLNHLSDERVSPAACQAIASIGEKAFSPLFELVDSSKDRKQLSAIAWVFTFFGQPAIERLSARIRSGDQSISNRSIVLLSEVCFCRLMLDVSNDRLAAAKPSYRLPPELVAWMAEKYADTSSLVVRSIALDAVYSESSKDLLVKLIEKEDADKETRIGDQALLAIAMSSKLLPEGSTQNRMFDLVYRLLPLNRITVGSMVLSQLSFQKGFVRVKGAVPQLVALATDDRMAKSVGDVLDFAIGHVNELDIAGQLFTLLDKPEDQEKVIRIAGYIPSLKANFVPKLMEMTKSDTRFELAGRALMQLECPDVIPILIDQAKKGGMRGAIAADVLSSDYKHEKELAELCPSLARILTANHLNARRKCLEVIDQRMHEVSDDGLIEALERISADDRNPECKKLAASALKRVRRKGNISRAIGGRRPPSDKGLLWGYLGHDGSIVVKPQFEVAGRFFDGRAVVKQDGMFGFIDKKGVFLIKPQFRSVLSTYDSGVAEVVTESGKRVFIDKSGMLVSRELADRMKHGKQAGSGRMREQAPLKSFRRGGKYGFKDKSGQIVVPPKYDWVSWNFQNGHAWVSVDGKYGLINAQGKEVVPHVYSFINLPDKNVAMARKGDKLVAIDLQTGAATEKTRAERISSRFFDGLALLSDGKLYGLYSQDGDVVVPAKYRAVRQPSEGMTAFAIAKPSMKNVDEMLAKADRKINNPAVYLRDMRVVVKEDTASDIKSGEQLVLYWRSPGHRIARIEDSKGNLISARGRPALIRGYKYLRWIVPDPYSLYYGCSLSSTKQGDVLYVRSTRCRLCDPEWLWLFVDGQGIPAEEKGSASVSLDSLLDCKKTSNRVSLGDIVSQFHYIDRGSKKVLSEVRRFSELRAGIEKLELLDYKRFGSYELPTRVVLTSDDGRIEARLSYEIDSGRAETVARVLGGRSMAFKDSMDQ